MDYGRLFFDPPAPAPAPRSSSIFFMGSNYSIPKSGSRTLLSMEENPSSWKRPYFSSVPEEFIYPEDIYDDQTPEKKRRLTPAQVNILERSFEEENKLEPERKSELAKKLLMQPRQVAVWFQNRRARSKTKQLERDYDLLKASYDSLLSNYQSLLKDNNLLKSQVHSMTEKLQAKGAMDGPPSPTCDPVQVEEEVKEAEISAQRQLSSGGSSGAASDVVNEDNENPQLMADDSEDVSKDNPSCYLPCMFTVYDHHKEEEKQDLGWWGWY